MRSFPINISLLLLTINLTSYLSYMTIVEIYNTATEMFTLFFLWINHHFIIMNTNVQENAAKSMKFGFFQEFRLH